MITYFGRKSSCKSSTTKNVFEGIYFTSGVGKKSDYLKIFETSVLFIFSLSAHYLVASSNSTGSLWLAGWMVRLTLYNPPIYHLIYFFLGDPEYNSPGLRANHRFPTVFR